MNKWTSTECDCFDDCGICLYGCFCPCCLYGSNVEKRTGEGFWGNCCVYFFCAPCICLCHQSHRKSLRLQYNLEPQCGNDCLATCCWWNACAVCQEARELKTRGAATARGGGPPTMNMSLNSNIIS